MQPFLAKGQADPTGSSRASPLAATLVVPPPTGEMAPKRGAAPKAQASKAKRAKLDLPAKAVPESLLEQQEEEHREERQKIKSKELTEETKLAKVIKAMSMVMVGSAGPDLVSGFLGHAHLVLGKLDLEVRDLFGASAFAPKRSPNTNLRFVYLGGV